MTIDQLATDYAAKVKARIEATHNATTWSAAQEKARYEERLAFQELIAKRSELSEAIVT